MMVPKRRSFWLKTGDIVPGWLGEGYYRLRWYVVAGIAVYPPELILAVSQQQSGENVSLYPDALLATFAASRAWSGDCVLSLPFQFPFTMKFSNSGAGAVVVEYLGAGPPAGSLCVKAR